MLHKITTRAQVAHITVSWLPFSALDWLLPARTRDLVCSLSIPLSFALTATFLWSGVCVYVACGNMKRNLPPCQLLFFTVVCVQGRCVGGRGQRYLWLWLGACALSKAI